MLSIHICMYICKIYICHVEVFAAEQREEDVRTPDFCSAPHFLEAESAAVSLNPHRWYVRIWMTASRSDCMCARVCRCAHAWVSHAYSRWSRAWPAVQKVTSVWRLRAHTIAKPSNRRNCWLARLVLSWTWFSFTVLMSEREIKRTLAHSPSSKL